MTDKIYEYKDDQNWFIGRWGGFNTLSGLGNVSHDGFFELSMVLRDALGHLEDQPFPPQGFDVTIVKKSSDYQLFRFIIDIVVAETGRSLQVHQKAGALLVTEGDQLILVHLPEGGVQTAAFFGDQDRLSDTILIATKNEGKTKEFRKFFSQMGIEVENLNDYPELPDIAETGVTFEENARLKAETIANLTGRMVLADDSGLKVDVLGGLPGVWSARFSGPDATDDSNNAKLLHELAVVFEKEDRSAQFHCCLVVAAPGKDSLVVEAEWPGYIAFEPRGEQGFGYDPLFLVGESHQTAAEMSLEEKNQVSHRALALKRLWEEFPAWQAK